MTNDSTNNTSLLRKRQTNFAEFKKQQAQIQSSPEGQARSANRAKRLAEMESHNQAQAAIKKASQK